jgi:hypothetical protein
VVVAWGVGAFAGSWVAARLARPGGSLGHGLVIGGLLFVATVLNLRMVPHPVWMWVVGLAEIPALSYLGARLAVSRTAAAQPAPAAESV